MNGAVHNGGRRAGRLCPQLLLHYRNFIALRTSGPGGKVQRCTPPFDSRSLGLCLAPLRSGTCVCVCI